MVLHKRLDYGFNGYQVPPTPRAPRSVRRRAPFRKKPEDNKMCAFDLLAIVAGKLLHEGESSSNASGNKAQCAAVDNPNNNVKTALQDEKSLKVEVHDQGSPTRRFFVSDTVPAAHEQNDSSQEFLSGQSVLNLGLASSVTPDCAESIDAEKLVHGQNKIETAAFPGKVEVDSSTCRELEDCKLEGGIDRIVKDEPNKFGNVVSGSVGNMCSLEDPAALDGKPPALVSSDGCAKAPLSGNHTPFRSYPENQDVDVVSRDDDENSSGCTHPRTTKKFIRAASHIGDRRIRKILASKYWKVTPRMKDIKLSNTDGEMKPVYRSRKNYYKSQRSERLYPFKKRKHLGYNSPSNSNGEISCEFGLDSHQKGNDGGAYICCLHMRALLYLL